MTSLSIFSLKSLLNKSVALSFKILVIASSTNLTSISFATADSMPLSTILKEKFATCIFSSSFSKNSLQRT
ncbi:hypothetical protein CJF57_00155 [Staphylococcus phage UPMK_1]|nr:hypothetical protein CJF57_00155 [Staphylococcus phage UPMK_1]